MFLLNKRALCTLHTHGLGQLLSQWVAQNNLTKTEVGNSFHLRVLWGLVHTQLVVLLITISCIVSVLFPVKLGRISKYVQLFPHYQSSFDIAHSYCLPGVSSNQLSGNGLIRTWLAEWLWTPHMGYFLQFSILNEEFWDWWTLIWSSARIVIELLRL